MRTGTTKQMIAGQRRSLEAIKRKLEAMSAEWADVDAFNESELQSLAEKCIEVGEGLVAPDD